MKVLQFPLARLTFFFVLGILLAYYLKPDPFWTFLFLFFTCFVTVLLGFLSVKQDFQSVYFGASLFVLAIGIGASNQVVHTAKLQKNHYVNIVSKSKKQATFEMVVTEKLKTTSFSRRFIAKVTRVNLITSSGKVLLNIPDAGVFDALKIGSIVRVNGSIVTNQKSKNPFQFDYGLYLENQQIYAQLFCKPGTLKVSQLVYKDLWYYASEFRTKIIQNLNKEKFGKNELSVIMALLLGQQQDIDSDIIKDYQYAGAVHVLSVSGLHVGFILLFVTFLMKPIPNSSKGLLLKLIITLLSLWSFGFVAGLAPSVLRSVTMFSFVAVGLFLKRSINIYHTLLVSLLLILLVQPAFLFDVGFQLSYISLFFIVWLQPLLSVVYAPSNKVLSYIWNLLTVSFAAQIGALPLSIYYFHQFPGLFFITNLVILPFMGILLAVGVFVLLLASFGYVPHLPMKLLEWGIFILNKIINWIASFQSFIVQNISFNSMMLWTSYFMIITFFVWIQKPKFYKLILALLGVLSFQLACLETKYYCQKQNELIVFHVKKQSLVAARQGQKTTVYTSDTLNQKKKNSLLLNYTVGNFSTVTTVKPLPRLLYFNKKKILLLDSLALYPTSISPDVVLITHSPKLNLQRFLLTCHPKLIIADGSNFKSFVANWKATCLQNEIPFHATAEKGFIKL